jgi:hypothetical protein
VRGVFFPRKDVSHEVDLIPQISTADTLRLYDMDTSGRGELAEVGKAELNPKDMKNADAAYRHEKRQTRQGLISVGIRMEKLAFDQLRDTSVMTQFQTFTSSTRWDAYSSPDSTPIEDLQAAVRGVRIRTGTAAGAKGRDGQGLIKIAMHEYAWMALQQNDAVRAFISASIGGSGTRILTKKILAESLEIGEADIHIISARYTKTPQGTPAADETFTSFIGDDVIVAMCDSDAENDQALGHEFVFDGLGGEDPFLVTKWTQFGVGVYQRTEWVGVSCMVDYKTTNAASAGFLLKGVIDKTLPIYGGEVGSA